MRRITPYGVDAPTTGCGDLDIDAYIRYTRLVTHIHSLHPFIHPPDAGDYVPM